jgi:hypothetical protein
MRRRQVSTTISIRFASRGGARTATSTLACCSIATPAVRTQPRLRGVECLILTSCCIARHTQNPRLGQRCLYLRRALVDHRA